MNSVTLDWHGAVAVISLNRPDAANAINNDLADALREAAEAIASDGRARAVIVRAEGKMFSGGGDIGTYGLAGCRVHDSQLVVVAEKSPEASRLHRHEFRTIRIKRVDDDHTGLHYHE